MSSQIRGRLGLVAVLLSACGSSSGPDAEGFRYPSVAFVASCTRSHELADDPIKHPGHAGASHLHSFFGNVSTAAASSYASMLSAQTTCSEKDDTGAYWTPSPAGEVVRAYYDRGSVAPAMVVAPTADLKALSSSVAWRCGSIADGPDAVGWVDKVPPVCNLPARPMVRYTFPQIENQARLRLVMPWVGPPPDGIEPHADFWNTWQQDRLEHLTKICIRGERASNLDIKQCNLPGAT